jgi:hypothetical protein
VNFLAVHGKFTRRFNSDSHLLAANGDHGDSDILANYNFLARPA